MRRDSTEAELDALQRVGDRLAGFDPRLSAEWLDGALTALMAGPRVPASPHAAVQSLSGDAWERTFADPDDVGRAHAALDARWRALRAQLDPDSLADAPDALHLSPLLLVPSADADANANATAAADDDDGDAAPPLGGDWADGFLAVVRDAESGWGAEPPGAVDAAPETTDPSDRAAGWRTLLSPIERLADAATTAAGDSAQDRVDAACFAAQDLRLWWSDHAPRTAPRRVDPVPGRNDPCPCGSGRKYKKCHGAAG